MAVCESYFQDMQGQTALHHVISSQRTRAVPILLTAGADLTLLNSNLLTPLLEATGYGFLPYVNLIHTSQLSSTYT